MQSSLPKLRRFRRTAPASLLEEESEPPADTFGPLGIAERLNRLEAKNLWMNTPSQWRISVKSKNAGRM